MQSIRSAIFKTFIISLMMAANINFAYSQTASILPPAKTSFYDANGNPLSGGTINFYIPSTTTPKTTWQDAAETIPNTNPVILDSAGRALILGSGSYRQIVKDQNNNIIWDQVTASAGSGGGGSISSGDGDLVGTIKQWSGPTAPAQYMFTYGETLSRTTFATLFTAITSSQGINCQIGNPTITGLTDTTNFWIGMTVELPCVTGGNSTIISKTSTSVTLALSSTVNLNTTATFFMWGNGNGTTTFTLPDFRGLIPTGNNNMGGVASTNLTTTYFGSSNPNSIGAAGGSQSYIFLQTNLPSVNFTVASGQTVSTTSTSSDIIRWTGGTSSSNAAGGSNSQLIGVGGPGPSNIPSTGTVTNTGNAASGGSSTPFSLVQPSKTVNFIIKVTPDVTGLVAANPVTCSAYNWINAIASGNATCTGITGGAAQGARAASAMNIDSVTAIGDTNYVMLNTDRTIYNNILTAARTDTLIASTSVNPGQVITFSDQDGLVSSSNTITLIPSGSDTVNGGSSFVALNSSHGITTCVTDGISKWNCQQLSGGSTAGVTTVNSAGGNIIINSGVGINVSTVGGTISISATGNTRTVLTSPTTFFVGPPGTAVDKVGCGLASGASACATRGYLYNIFASSYDFGNQTVTVQIADGTYTDSLQAQGQLIPGQSSATGLIFTGNCTTPTNVLIQPTGGSGYDYSADGGIGYRIQCQKLDQTGQRSVFPNGADIVVAGHGSRIYFGNSALLGIRQDVIFGCNFNGFNAITAAFGSYVEWDNDFGIDVGLCQETPTGTVTSGSANITSVSSTTGVVEGMNVVASGIPSDAYVGSTSTGVISILCIFTSPCQATSSPGAETITITGGGQSFLDMGNGATGYFATNGDPDASLLGTLGNFPFYHAGWFFINEGSTINAQAITWVNPGQAHGACSVAKTLSNIDTNLQGIPYIPCHSLAPEATQGSTVTAGANQITVSSTTGIKAGQIVADIAAPTATWTAGSPTVVVSSNTGICVGSKVTGPGILTGAVVTNISGTTITIGGCGFGARCVGGNPTYLSETNSTTFFTNCLIAANTVVVSTTSTTVLMTGDQPLGSVVKASGTGTLWFQGQVYRNSVYD